MYERAYVVRAKDGRAPDVFRPREWVPMRCYSDDDEVQNIIPAKMCGGADI